MRIGQKSWEVDVIPVSWAIDGGVAPGALSTLDSTNKVRYRDFAGGADNDIFLEWEVPYGMDISEGIFFQVEGWITAVVGPAVGETAKFSLQGTSLGDSDPLSQAMGTAITVTKTFIAGFVQNDRFVSGWSGKVTLANLAAGELIVLSLKRDTTGSYSQAIGVGWLKVKYAKKSQQS